jgi:hypothetical protein
MPQATIYADLHARIERFRLRYKGEFPKELPVTLDEWSWLGERLYGNDKHMFAVPMDFMGVPLRLVDGVYETKDGALVVRP